MRPRNFVLAVATTLGIYIGLERYAKGWKRPHRKDRLRAIDRALDGYDWREAASGACEMNDDEPTQVRGRAA